jgi:hypothetical protein
MSLLRGAMPSSRAMMASLSIVADETGKVSKAALMPGMQLDQSSPRLLSVPSNRRLLQHYETL